MKAGVSGVVALIVLAALAVVAYTSLFVVRQTEQALVVRLGEPVRVVTDPGLNFKVPFIDTVISIDKRILDLENPAQEIIASDQKRLVVDAFARYRIKNALRFYQTVGSIQAANIQLGDAAQRGAAPCARRGDVHQPGARQSPRADDSHPRAARPRSRRLRHRGRRCAHSPRRSARAEQPGGLSADADRASARGGGVPRRRRAARAGDPLARRS